ncbi:hypothetical protein C2G38_2224521 [Gigaspora rosea]|uniref:SWIM-type domain-containing protein n=1 Tax=Gigaspora rosea TaxID=44941 RepID=A0A397U016_9GLOM|nr:hypothetical protein C2G38_2224521 [Gigaspora rosea]
MERFYEWRLLGFAHNHAGHMKITKRFFCPSWENFDADSIKKLTNNDEYQISSEKTTLTYIVNSAIGTCSCPVGLTRAPCKHQGEVAAKYHIGAINFLPTMTVNDHLDTMDHSFYAALHAKSIVVEKINLLQDITANNTMLNRRGYVNEGPKLFIYRESINSLEIEESEHQVINLPEIEELEYQPKNLLEIEELEHQVNNSLETEKLNLLRIEESDHNSFINFLEEIKEDYENWDPQLCKALDKFSARYKAAKTQSTP